MIFLLENLEGRDSITLPEEKDYVLGRKNCDILILNDQSISREHARLRVKDGSVTLEDCKSRYHTVYNGFKLEPYVPVNLKHMDLIHFGILHSKFRFECPKFIVSASGLSMDAKTILKQHLKACNSKYMDKWSSVCTHLAVEKLTLTVKILQALVQGKPIVTVDYWADYAKAIENSRPAPDLAKYRKPPVAEHLFSSDFELTYDERRKSLFANKVFVFLKVSTKKQLDDIIKSCGGSCFSWDEAPKIVSDISSSPLEHLLIKTDTDEDGNESFQDLVKCMAKQKKRMIPVSEIALAIVSCSCDVNCNPSFNKAAQVFAAPAHKTQLGNVLVGETQTQPAFSKSLAVETEKAIPGSLPEDDWVTEVGARPKLPKRPSGEETESPLCKKPKLDNNTSKQSKWISLDKSINLPKRQENTSETSRRMEKSTLQGQASVKRKASDDSEQCLKINTFTNMSTSVSKKRKTGSANPFALFKPISKPTRPETARKSSNPFASIMSTNRPTTTVKIEEIEIENSPPPESRPESTRNTFVHSAISIKQLSVNFRWISKSLPSVHSVKVITDDDPELLEISKALRDCVQVTTLPVYERPTPSVNETQNSVGVRNFKKFKKVKPLRPQVTIISHHQLERVGPGDISKITLNEHFSDDEQEPIRSRKFPNFKPVGKRFIL